MSEPLNTTGAPIQQQPSNVASMDKSGASDYASTHGEQMSNVPKDVKQFSTGIFDCGAPDFLFACCCSCIAHGKNRQRFDALKENRVLATEQIEPFSEPTLIMLALNCCTGCGWIMDFFQRGKIRAQYHIAGTDAEDVGLSCCCLPCSILQQDRELTLEEGLMQSKA